MKFPNLSSVLAPKPPVLTPEFKNQLIDKMWTEGVAPPELFGLFQHTDNYLEYRVDSIEEQIALMKLRDTYVHKYGFAILSEPLLDIYEAFLKGKEVVEIGAGSGWLSHKLQERGIAITPVDMAVGESNAYGFHKPFTDIVHESAATYLSRHNPSVVVMSWPNYNTDFAYEVLSLLKPGQTLIYVGEGLGGCCAKDNFFELLEEKAILQEGATQLFESENLQWPHIHDEHYVYQIK